MVERNVLASEGGVFYACGGRIPLGGTRADGPSSRRSAVSMLADQGKRLNLTIGFNLVL